MAVIATWVVATARRKVVVQLRQGSTVEWRRTESGGSRPRGKVDHLPNMTPYGDTSVALVGQPSDEAIKMWAGTSGPIPRNG